jgi:hypothetical protein
MQNEATNVLDYFKKCLDEIDESTDEDSCLITGENLTKYHVILMCGHKFNYIPLFKEVYQQKCVINHKEIVKVPRKCVKCPYCRNVGIGILPYRESIEPTKLYGVNWPKNHSIKMNLCSYILRSGKNRDNACGIACVDSYCPRHIISAENVKLVVDKSISIKEINHPDVDVKNTCSKLVGTKKSHRLCKNRVKDKGLCGIHLKINEHIE